MRKIKNAAALAALVALAAAPAASAAAPDHAKANGKRCQGVSKKHVKGEKGTPFSQCVKAGKKVKPAPAPEPAPEQPAPTEPAPETAPAS